MRVHLRTFAHHPKWCLLSQPVVAQTPPSVIAPHVCIPRAYGTAAGAMSCVTVMLPHTFLGPLCQSPFFPRQFSSKITFKFCSWVLCVGLPHHGEGVKYISLGACNECRLHAQLSRGMRPVWNGCRKAAEVHSEAQASQYTHIPYSFLW